MTSTLPLDLDRAVELVQKVPFDDPVKQKFVGDLRLDLFRRHESFLSNPLLLSIMLLTYRDVAHIPNKLSIFYNQAYESLFQKHDALKSGFQRERQSGLDIQDFGRAFSAFCIQSYDAREFSFSQLRALEILEHGQKITQLAYDPRALLDDALQAVCLLVEEGMEITFAHRSFQEYFVARFIHSCPPEVKPKLVKRLILSAPTDTVMSLLHELDPYTVEEHYILPAIEILKKRIKLVRGVGVSHFLRYLKCVWKEFIAHPESPMLSGTFADHGLFSAIHFAWQHYIPNRQEWPSKEQRKAMYDAVVDACDEEAQADKSRRVPTKNLTTGSKLVRFLFDSPGVWGASYLRDLLSVEGVIRQRHKVTESSLDAIFSEARNR
jgi:hypothetical protein